MVDKSMADRVGIILDGCRYEVDAGENLLQACVSLGLDLPYFCWHPALGSVGSCRQCAVIQYQNDEDDSGRLVMACMTPVSEGMRVSLQQETARQFRKTNIEALMTNHPHDCPVCEEGGNCHLQDMTLMSGHIKRGYPGTKRTHKNQQLGPFLNHEMNRCIACYRCVRFYRDYAGGTDLDVFGSKNHLYFGRAESGMLANPFAGNLAEICPTGVFTDKPYSRHYVRKWDLQTGAAICSNCSLGCNINVGERGGLVRRISNRYHAAINGHFLCDLGRFGYEHVNLSQRLEQPLQRNNAERTTERLGAEAAKALLAELVNQNNSHQEKTDNTQARAGCIALGSARSTIENNAALLRLVGKDNFYLGVPDTQAVMLRLLCDAYSQGRVKPTSMKEIEASDAAFIIAEDISHTAPRLALTLRQMSRNAGKAKAQTFGVQIWQDDAVRNLTQSLRSPLHILASHETELADVAKQNLVLPLEGQLRLLRAVLAQLTQTPPAGAHTETHADLLSAQAGEIVADLLAARRPVLICGTQSNEPELLRLCLEIAERLQARPQHDRTQTGFYGVTRHPNDLFLGLIAQAQSLAPSPLGIDALLSRLADEPIETLIILETDLYRYCDKDRLDKLLDRVTQLIVIEQQLTPTAQMADLLLPASSFAESQGCWLSAEGRLQFSFAAMPAIEARAQAWQWLSGAQAQDEPRCRSELIAWLAQALPALAAINAFAAPQEFKTLSPFPIARQPLRASARTALHAGEHVREPQPPADPSSPYVYSMEGVAGFRQARTQIISVLPADAWSPKWNSDQAGSLRTALLQSPQDSGLGLSEGPPEPETDPAPGADQKIEDQTSDCWRHGICIFSQTEPDQKESGQTEPGAIPVTASAPEAATAVFSAAALSVAALPVGVWPLAPDANRYADAELACLGDAIRAAMPEPRVRLHPESADKLGLVQGDDIRLSRYPSPGDSESADVCLSCTLDAAVAREQLLVPTLVFIRLGQLARVTAGPHGTKGGEHD
ncbi:NADH-quinone oxidoreductase subunit NuoG [Shewanella sp. AS16]|uniref:NADH-quinone oxidoreductase subunit NuoG n=1 Tax=Shewanella sp. AS16 TaxID=2907625 RepID=UPI001F2FFE94|nr:NADH-quinone oxidoreductase subunit NuoG [Shewanella sp. AS16]MCE9687723.1 NADH-quinone oxidoreductase subunit NuoG [Shewanella sp. AS16]